MALYHFHVDRVSRGAGQSAVASVAYRAGERLRDDYYGGFHDYTRKGGVIMSEILLTVSAPERFLDRQTLWNELEKAEKHPQAQLAYTFATRCIEMGIKPKVLQTILGHSDFMLTMNLYVHTTDEELVEEMKKLVMF